MERTFRRVPVAGIFDGQNTKEAKCEERADSLRSYLKTLVGPGHNLVIKRDNRGDFIGCSHCGAEWRED